MRKTFAAFLALAASAWAPAALACGTCAEDKIAATYDHATTQRAAAAGQVMVYCELAGASWDAARLKRVAARVRGLDAATVRVAREPAAVSFALDPRQQSPQAAVLALQALAPAGARVRLVRAGATAAQ